MRDELRSLEGETVALCGRICEIRKRDGHKDLLIKACEVWAWDGWSRICEGEPDARPDHLWVRFEGEELPNEKGLVELWKRLMMVGKIRYYRRSKDLSVDLGFESLSFINVDKLGDKSVECLNEYQRTGDLEAFEKTVKTLEMAVMALVEHARAFSFAMDREQAIRFVIDVHTKLKRSFEATKSRIEAGHRGGKCKGLDAFKAPRPKSRAACGF